MIVYVCLKVQQINCSERKMLDFSLAPFRVPPKDDLIVSAQL